jgi:hypothetical protein
MYITKTTAHLATQPTGAAPLDRFLTRLRNTFAGAMIVVGVAGFAAAGHAGDLPGAFRGNAYATFANVQAGQVAAQLGRSANQPCPCEGTNGVTLSNEVDSLQAGDNGDVLNAGTTVSTALTEKTSTTAEVTNSSTITGLSILGGLITADAIAAVADVSVATTTMTGSSTGSKLVNLKIAGSPIDANVAPNSVVEVPGLGTVTLYKVTRSGSFRANGQILVEMLTINVTVANNLGLPVGAQVVVAHAVAGYNRTQPDVVVDGSAYAALANDDVGSELENKIGKVAFVTMGCEGTNGKVRSNNVTAESAGTVVSLGSGVSTAQSMSSPGSTVARTTSVVQNVSLLGGLIKAATVTAVAQESLAGGTVTPSTEGSGLVGLTIAGIPIPVNVAPNTGISLPGVGEVIVNEQKLPANPGDEVSVNGLHLKVTLANLLGLPVGSELVIAHANAGAAPF